MNRKGPQKYSKEMIQSALVKLESGARMIDIARELGVPKNTVKYWLDHANKHLPEAPRRNIVAARLQKRLTLETWDIIFAALKVIKEKLPETSVRDLVAVISELFDRQAQFGSLTGRGAIPEKVFEKSEEVRITVQSYLKKQSAGEEPKTSQSNSTPEPSQRLGAEEKAAAIEAEKAGGNGAI